MKINKRLEIKYKYWLFNQYSDNITDEFMKAIARALRENKKVTISGFGTFSIKEKKASRRRHPTTGELITIPAKTKPHFKPCKELAADVAKHVHTNTK